MPLALPPDFDFAQGAAVVLLFGCWLCYSVLLRTISRGSLNEQLTAVRVQWLRNSLVRGQKPFDAILLGQIVNSIAFFGSATMIVLAGVITLFASVRSVFDTVAALHLTAPASFELFVVQIAILNAILAMCFFSFTYALRKLIYVIALVGALPEGPIADDVERRRREAMVTDAGTVLSEALKTFNFGIRGYYYALAGLGLVISPYLSIVLTILATAVLIHRQIATKTASAIRHYVQTVHHDKQ